MNINKKNMILFTNCHGEKYIKMFERDSDIKKFFDINYIVSYQSLNNYSLYKSSFEKADVLIINNIKNYNDFTISNLKKILKKECLLIILPFVRFEGYWIPEHYKKLKYIGDNSVSFFPNIDFCFNIKKYLNIKVNETEYLNFYNQCLDKLKIIENESDIKFYDFFINNHLEYPMFRDNYHPTLNMLEYIGSEIMKIINNKFKINYNKTKPKLIKNTLEYGHYKPIINNIKELLNIEYDLDEIFITSRTEYLTKILIYESINNEIIKDLDDMKIKFKWDKEKCNN